MFRNNLSGILSGVGATLAVGLLFLWSPWSSDKQAEESLSGGEVLAAEEDGSFLSDRPEEILLQDSDGGMQFVPPSEELTAEYSEEAVAALDSVLQTSRDLSEILVEYQPPASPAPEYFGGRGDTTDNLIWAKSEVANLVGTSEQALLFLQDYFYPLTEEGERHFYSIRADMSFLFNENLTLTAVCQGQNRCE